MADDPRQPNRTPLELMSLSDDLSEPRLWRVLDGISNRLSNIEHQLSEVVRLEERVKSHEQALSRYGNRLDSHDKRLHESELWQAGLGDHSTIERTVADMGLRVKNLETTGSVDKGQKNVSKEILKWLAGLLAAFIMFKITMAP